MVTIYPKLTQERVRFLEKNAPDLLEKVIQESQDSTIKSLESRNVVRYEVESDFKILKQIDQQNRALLVFAIILSPLVIPGFIVILAMLYNQNRAINIKNNMLGKKTYHGFYLKRMAEEDFKQPLEVSFKDAQEQIIKDVARGVRLSGFDLRNIPNDLIQDDELDLLLNMFIDSSDGMKDDIIMQIQDRLKHNLQASNSSLLKQFFTDSMIEDLFSKKALLKELKLAIDGKEGEEIFKYLKDSLSTHILASIVNENNCEALVSHLMPNATKAQLMNVIKGHNQSIMTAVQLIDYVMLVQNGYTLSQDYMANIFYDETDQKVHYNVSKSQIIFKSCEGENAGSEYPIKGHFEIEYILEDDGFVLKDIKISDAKLAKLVFAKDKDELRAGLQSYDIPLPERA